VTIFTVLMIVTGELDRMGGPRVGIRSNSREVSGEGAGAPLAGALHTVRARLN